MNAAGLIEALALPAGARIDQRVPKRTLAEHSATKTTSRRQIQDGIEAIRWTAALKPSNCGVPAYKDDVREYIEIAVLEVQLRSAGRLATLLPLIHRAIPYPTLLVGSAAGVETLSLAHKRWSQSEKGQVVVDGELAWIRLEAEVPEPTRESFLSALALAKQPRATLYDLYQGWLDTLLAMQAATMLGDFSLPRNREHADTRSEALRDCERLESEMASLRAAAVRETQLPRRVELNLQLKRLADAHAAARARL